MVVADVLRGLFNAPSTSDAGELLRRAEAAEPDAEALYPAIMLERWRLYPRAGVDARSDEWLAANGGGVTHEQLSAAEVEPSIQRLALSYVRYLNLVY
jgi:hypothetical protein